MLRTDRNSEKPGDRKEEESHTEGDRLVSCGETRAYLRTWGARRPGMGPSGAVSARIISVGSSIVPRPTLLICKKKITIPV